MEVRGDLSSTVENKESFTSRPSAWKNFASALVLCAFKNSKSSRFFRYQINIVALFSTGGRSTRKTLLIFHGTRQVSPHFHLFHKTFEKKRKVRSPLPKQSNFLVFGIYFTFFENMSTYVV